MFWYINATLNILTEQLHTDVLEIFWKLSYNSVYFDTFCFVKQRFELELTINMFWNVMPILRIRWMVNVFIWPIIWKFFFQKSDSHFQIKRRPLIHQMEFQIGIEVLSPVFICESHHKWVYIYFTMYFTVVKSIALKWFIWYFTRVNPKMVQIQHIIFMKIMKIAFMKTLKTANCKNISLVKYILLQKLNLYTASRVSILSSCTLQNLLLSYSNKRLGSRKIININLSKVFELQKRSL